MNFKMPALGQPQGLPLQRIGQELFSYQSSYGSHGLTAPENQRTRTISERN